MTVRIIAWAFAVVVLYGLWLHWSEWLNVRRVWRDIHEDIQSDALLIATVQEFMDSAHFKLAIQALLLIPAFSMNWLPAAPVPVGWLIVNRSGLVLIALLSMWRARRIRRDRWWILRLLARLRDDRP